MDKFGLILARTCQFCKTSNRKCIRWVISIHRCTILKNSAFECILSKLYTSHSKSLQVAFCFNRCQEKVMNDLLNIEKLRPYCPRTSSDALNNLFCLVRECWAEHGVFRPDSRQIYSKIKDIQRELNIKTTVTSS